MITMLRPCDTPPRKHCVHAPASPSEPKNDRTNRPTGSDCAGCTVPTFGGGWRLDSQKRHKDHLLAVLPFECGWSSSFVHHPCEAAIFFHFSWVLPTTGLKDDLKRRRLPSSTSLLLVAARLEFASAKPWEYAWAMTIQLKPDQVHANLAKRKEGWLADRRQR